MFRKLRKRIKEKICFWCNPGYRKIVYRNKKKELHQWINNHHLTYSRIKINVSYFIFRHNRIGLFIRLYKMYRDTANGWNVRLYDNTGNLIHEGKGVY